jgi:uncharacterized protein YbaA (DUF1428 family)
MSYVDGVVIPVPVANKEKYTALAEKMAGMFKEHGALQAVECWGSDIPPGQVTSMPMAVQLKEDETVVFSWIMWPSKEVRDQAWEKIMAAGDMHGPDGMPFDGMRLIYGGFDVIVEA